MHEIKYSAALTGASFLLFELKQVLQLKDKGLTDPEIKEKVLTDNLFQFTQKSSVKRSFPSVLKRASALDFTLCKYVLEDALESGKIINLYAIMKTDRLFFEFMNEVIREKIESNDLLLEKKDMNLYFATKAEQDSDIASWSIQTTNKLKQVFGKIIYEAGILKDKKTGELCRLLIDEHLKNHLIAIGDSAFLRAMGVQVR